MDASSIQTFAIPKSICRKPSSIRFKIKPSQPVDVFDGTTLGLARWGLIPSWHRGNLAEWKASAIMTRAANNHIGLLHDRMPVTLNSKEPEIWMTGARADDLGAEARLNLHPVACFKLEDDGPLLIEPIEL